MHQNAGAENVGHVEICIALAVGGQPISNRTPDRCDGKSNRFGLSHSCLRPHPLFLKGALPDRTPGKHASV